jgi:lipopolysaccharide transport system ATP-binding protein
MKHIIEVNHLSKKYKYSESQSYYTLRDTLTGLAKARFRLLNRTRDRGDLGKGEFWALKDISFKVDQGDVLGIIGPNGSGKSTMLKVLSRITPPTKGTISLRGRVGSLLEVGTGFHYELTGRENIFLNGAILGMGKREIARKFDEIVDFAGVDKFLDTPVKRYSSGMYMRLAFAVAAHLDSEIILVDEVLAVGDAEFQKKCLGKMQDLSKKEGRTVLFVSHNMGAVAQLCNKAVVLKDGQIAFKGSVDKSVSLYLDKYKSAGSVFKRVKSNLKDGNQFVLISNVDSAYKARSEFGYSDEIRIIFEMSLPNWDDTLEVGIFPCDKFGRRIFMIEVPLKKYYSGKPSMKLSVTIPSKILTVGEYSWEIFIHNPLTSLHDHQKGICNFTINETGSPFSKYNNYDCGVVYPPAYSIDKII